MWNSSAADCPETRERAVNGRDWLCTASDRGLLERFFDTRDVATLELLVTQHMSLVAGVCRRILGASADADDAVQATFLVW